MLFKLVQFTTLLGFSFIISQPIFYLLAFSKVQKQMDGPLYVELRQLVDRHLAVSLRIVYYGALISSILLVVISATGSSGFEFVSSAIALAALIIDMYFLLSGSIPINKVIGSWSATQYPADWASYRSKWFSHFGKRQVADFIAFLSLLAAAVFL